MHRQINLFLSEIQLQLIVPDTIIVLQSNNDGGGAGWYCHRMSFIHQFSSDQPHPRNVCFQHIWLID